MKVQILNFSISVSVTELVHCTGEHECADAEVIVVFTERLCERSRKKNMCYVYDSVWWITILHTHVSYANACACTGSGCPGPFVIDEIELTCLRFALIAVRPYRICVS